MGITNMGITSSGVARWRGNDAGAASFRRSRMGFCLVFASSKGYGLFGKLRIGFGMMPESFAP